MVNEQFMGSLSLNVDSFSSSPRIDSFSCCRSLNAEKIQAMKFPNILCVWCNYSTVTDTYLFLPISSVTNEKESQRLHNCSGHHSHPYSLKMHSSLLDLPNTNLKIGFLLKFWLTSTPLLSANPSIRPNGIPNM